MKKIIQFRRYICGYEEFDFSELYRQCTLGVRKLPINVFMIEHRKFGFTLINTGCTELLRKNPLAWSRWTAKRNISFAPEDTIIAQLQQEKSEPSVVKKVLLTHCDPECCGALPLLPNYQLLSTAGVLALLAVGNAQDGIMKNTVPSPQIQRKAAGLYTQSSPLKPYFKWIYDVFGDGSVLAVELSGHAQAMAGFFLPELNTLIAADASIDESALSQELLPSDTLLSRQAYPDDYLSSLITLKRLKREQPKIRMLFSHTQVLPPELGGKPAESN